MPHLMRKPAFCAPIAIALLAASPTPALAQDAAMLERGKAVFTTDSEPQCGICHALAAAGTVGEFGPNLDELKPTEEQVHAAVAGGVGVMPAYAELLSEEEIAAVAAYVAAAVGQANE